MGLLQAIGATRSQVLQLFLAEAIVLSFCGALLGIGIGWGFVITFVSLYPDFQASPPVWAVVSVLILSLAVGAVFGVLPARRATGLDPVVALSGK